MKKKSIFIAVAVVAAFGLATCTTSCSNDDPQAQKIGGKYTVTYYDGDTVLKTQKVKGGETFETYTPEKEGYTFMGWFATPTFSKKYDFSKGISENVSLFACFTSYVEDKRTFYIVGSGTSPVLSNSNWGKLFDDTTRMTKSDKADINEYTITIDLAKGDQFQFAINKDWANQRGAGYMTDVTYAGEECFKVQGSAYSDKTKKSNIECLKSGNYTFTLTTYPSGDYYDEKDSTYTEAGKEKYNYSNLDTITFVRNGDSTNVEEVSYDYYIKGSTVTGWDSIKEEKYKMTNTNGTYTMTIELSKGDEFLFYSVNPKTNNDGAAYLKSNILDTANSTNIEAAANGNFTVKENGTYTFTYDSAKDKLSVTYSEVYTKVYTPATTWYILGNGTSPLLKESNWGAVTTNHALTLVEGKTFEYTITLDLYEKDEFQICSSASWSDKHGFDFIENPGENFTKGGNITVSKAGNYTITLVLDANDATLDKLIIVRNGDVAA